MKLPTAWSYSRWSTHEKCPRQYRYRFVDKLPEPEGPALENGKRVHTAIEEYLTGRTDGPIPGWTYFERMFRDLRGLDPLVEQQWGFALGWKPTGWFGKDTWFRAVLDAAVIYDDGTCDVVDFKTGKESPDHSLQSELYALAVFSRYPAVKNITVRFWYLDIVEGKETVYHYGKVQIPELAKKWTERGNRLLADTTFPTKPGQQCKWCHFAKSNAGPCNFG